MPKAIRQENLYGAENWSVVYSSFKNAEFTSYDFDTLRDSMLNYMQNTYPEEFNDYTQNSEFIAILDLVAYVGQNLAFRMDLNARENILDTAEKRESVLRIARMLSYKPKRIRPAQGFLKITSLTTTDQILDSSGSNIANKVIRWGSDPSEIEYERFTRALNAAFVDNNKFGTPVKRSINSDTSTIYEVYQFNNTNSITNSPIGVIADGSRLNFDILPVDIKSDGYIDQVEPDYGNAFSLMYRNDGRGIGSAKTGFFFLAKQGNIASTVQYITDPIANMVINIDQTTSITEDDFFVQTIDEFGTVLKTWTRVPNLDFSNIALNEYSGSNKDLYEVVYGNNDVTSIKFGDGTFTNVPTGYIRVWYRLAENDFIKLKANDIENISFTVNYVNSIGQTHTLEATLQLQEDMLTGLPAESVNEIKNNAPEAFYSKNRMVTGDDYNGFLPTLNSDVLMMKAENRTFSGHSRYVDLKDPTGKSRPLVEFGDDGYFYKEESVKTYLLPDDPSMRTVDFLDELVENKLNDIGLINFYYGKLDFENSSDAGLFPLVNLPDVNTVTGKYNYVWRVAYNDLTSSNGYISEALDDDTPVKLGFTTSSPLRTVRPGSFVKFQNPANTSQSKWVAILDVKGDGLGIEDSNYEYTGHLVNGMGTVEINSSLTEQYMIKTIIPAFPRVFDDATRTALLDLIAIKRPFALKFDNQSPKWEVLTVPADLYADFDISDDSTAWLIAAEYKDDEGGYLLTTRQLDYVFGSKELIRFYNLNFKASFNTQFSPVTKDTISIVTLDSSNKLSTTQSYKIAGYYIYDDGYTDQSKVKVTPLDMDNDFLPDDPTHFVNLVGSSSINFDSYKEAGFSYIVPSTNQDSVTASTVKVMPGIVDVAFKWNHVTETGQTLNPSLTNIIDVYVLTKSYNDEYLKWKKKANTVLSAPLPMTTEELRSSFRDLLSYKMMTDEVIFHAAKFKPLFGKLADTEFQAQFKVVKSAKSKLTDNEIKSKVITAVDTFFTPGNFAFGETFYFTELAAYIHTALKNDLSSVVIVPISSTSKFGTLFQIQPDRDEIVTSVAGVGDVVVITEITDNNIRIGK